MDDIKEGSLVRAVKGSNVIEGVVTAARFIGDTQWQLGDARSCGYTVTVVEAPAAPPLPSEPGVYEAARFPLGNGDYNVPYILDLDRTWHTADDIEVLSVAYMQSLGGLTRLEPVPVTVQKVLQRVASYWEFGPPASIGLELDTIAAEFGGWVA